MPFGTYDWGPVTSTDPIPTIIPRCRTATRDVSLFRNRTLLQTMTVTWANCVHDFFRAVDLSPFPGHPSR